MIISIIGTRPQYIKVAPIYYYCKRNNIEHYIWDTNQHYNNNVSKDIIDSLGIKIDYNFKFAAFNELKFIYSIIRFFENDKIPLDAKFLIYGDTNSGFATAIALHKLGLKFGHAEAGSRCDNKNVPEEINRMYIDSVATINFCFFESAMKNINGIFCGSLEYELLNNLSDRLKKKEANYFIVTIHRQENLKGNNLVKIAKYIKKLSIHMGYKSRLILHHRLIKNKYFDSAMFDEVIDSMGFIEMMNQLYNCKFIVSDSGGLQKESPFYGKKCLVIRGETGNEETINAGYASICTFGDDDIAFLKEPVKEDRNFFIEKKMPSEIIIQKMLKL